jgi:hypothetical protein
LSTVQILDELVLSVYDIVLIEDPFRRVLIFHYSAFKLLQAGYQVLIGCSILHSGNYAHGR